LLIPFIIVQRSTLLLTPSHGVGCSSVATIVRGSLARWYGGSIVAGPCTFRRSTMAPADSTESAWRSDWILNSTLSQVQTSLLGSSSLPIFCAYRTGKDHDGNLIPMIRILGSSAVATVVAHGGNVSSVIVS